MSQTIPHLPAPTEAARMRRKTLVVCPTCHQAIHAQQPAALTS